MQVLSPANDTAATLSFSIFLPQNFRSNWLHWSFHRISCTQGWIQGGEWGDRPPPLKPTKVTLFTTILDNSENSIRDRRSFCRPLFCHSSGVKYPSFLLRQCIRNETWLPNITEIAPLPNLLAGSAAACTWRTWKMSLSSRCHNTSVAFRVT